MIMMRRSPWVIVAISIALCFGVGLLIGRHFLAA